MKPINASVFDERAATGDNLGEFFTDYAACDMGIDALIDEIFEEKQKLLPKHRHGAAGKAKSSSRDVNSYVTLVRHGVDQRREGYIIQAVLSTLDTSVRESACMGITFATVVAQEVQERFAKAALEGKLTYVSPSKREEKKRFQNGLPVHRTVAVSAR